MEHYLTEFELDTTLDILERLKYKRTFEHSGICANFGIALKKANIFEIERDIIEEWLRQKMAKWSKFSGRPFFPVPEPLIELEDFDSYYEYASYDDIMWDKNTEYGKLRFELLDFLISTVKTEIENVKTSGCF